MFKKIAPALCALTLLTACNTQNSPQSPTTKDIQPTFHNPILPGFYPDPAICRVGDDYYLVNSSFEYYPGIPIHHSKDLIHWQQIGYVLNSPTQCPLDHLKPSEGVFAPAIAYHDGTFYVANLMVGSLGTFIVTATNPAGPWSEPHPIKGITGIDPALFFDDDGTAWYIGNEDPTGGAAYVGEHEIFIQRINLQTFELTGEKTVIERGGAVKQAVWCEGPHLYKANGYYYLLISEGGTAEEHAISISRSKSITGPYELFNRNPILTHRNLGNTFPIQCAGHGDLVQTQTGQWWMVCLATRPYGGGMDYNMGRETFLAPVTWQNNWPIICPNVGHLQFTETAPNLPPHPFPKTPDTDDFTSPILPLQYNFLRTPHENFYSLTARPGWLRLQTRPEQVTDLVNPSWIGRRQQHMNFSATTRLDFTPATDTESAGLLVMLNNNFHYRFLKTLTPTGPQLQVIKREKGTETILASTPIPSGPIELKISAVGQDYAFAYRSSNNPWQTLAAKADGRILTTRACWGFTGVMLAMYTTSANHPSTNHADFDYFTYHGNDGLTN